LQAFEKQESEDSLQEELAMINKYLAMGLGALIALAPVAVSAQQVAQASTDSTAAAPAKAHTGSHRGHVRRKGNTAGHRARASAHHMHHMRHAPAKPAEAPKS
jgi:hypothetical protein